MNGTVGRALWAGGLAGLAAGVADALISWPRLGQFLPGAGGRLLCALYAGALAAFALSLLAAGVAAVAALLTRHTALGSAVAAVRAAQRRDPLVVLGIALAALPCLAGALAIAHAVGVATLAQRRHTGLVMAVTVGATAALLAAGALATFAGGRLVELGLRSLPARMRERLSHPLAPAIAVVAVVAVAGVSYAVAARKLLALLPLRPHIVVSIWAVLCLAALPLARRLLARIPPGRRALVHPAIVAGPLVLALLLGGGDAVRKGAAAHTGLTTPVTKLVHRLFDLDRDGYSSVLGGGDCADLDGAVNPGAVDVPGDGIDQNCLGGDAGGRVAARDPGFVALPAGVPPDANVLLITIDTLRADHVGAYGYGRPTTPALDGLAARGFLFENAWAHAPLTRYSMPAILTGRHPSEVAWDMSVWWPALKPENHTIAEVLKERGFRTGAILNYSYFDRVRRMDQGFDVYDNTNARLHTGRDPAETRGSSSVEQADAAIRFLEGHAAERFFLWVHFYDPHYEFEPHPGTTSFGGDRIALYDGEIRFTDDHIARVVARLGELGLDRRTIIVVTGDHGEGFGEHGVKFHGYHLYAAQTKVPLIMVVPGLSPRRVTTPVGHVDLLPTLANLTGGGPEPTMSGRSLLPFMLGQEESGRAVYQEVSYEGPVERRALATQTRHLIYNMIPDGTFELYDLAADPEETSDVWGSAPDGEELAARLAAMIEAATPGGGPDAAVTVLRAPPKPARAVTAELGESIRFLGVDLPETARPGDELSATWYYESLEPLSGPWKVFVHFEGPGRFLGDHDPAHGGLPIGRWKPGKIVADRHKLRVPAGTPPGEYTIYLGIYQGGTRLPVKAAGGADGGQDRIKVGNIRVE